jgi:hypothetical protein
MADREKERDRATGSALSFGDRLFVFVMPGLVPGIHVFLDDDE